MKDIIHRYREEGATIEVLTMMYEFMVPTLKSLKLCQLRSYHSLDYTIADIFMNEFRRYYKLMGENGDFLNTLRLFGSDFDEFRAVRTSKAALIARWHGAYRCGKRRNEATEDKRQGA